MESCSLDFMILLTSQENVKCTQICMYSTFNTFTVVDREQFSCTESKLCKVFVSKNSINKQEVLGRTPPTVLLLLHVYLLPQ
jgi:hypothetical protein